MKPATAPAIGPAWVTLENDMTRGSIASLEGREHEAADLWAEACRLAEEVMPIGVVSVVWAEAARYLGTDHPVGRERGRQAYVALASTGADRMLTMFADGLVVPDVAAAEAETA